MDGGSYISSYKNILIDIEEMREIKKLPPGRYHHNKYFRPGQFDVC